MTLLYLTIWIQCLICAFAASVNFSMYLVSRVINCERNVAIPVISAILYSHVDMLHVNTGTCVASARCFLALRRRNSQGIELYENTFSPTVFTHIKYFYQMSRAE